MSRSPVPSAPGAPPSHNGYVAIPRKLLSVRGVGAFGAACWPQAVLTSVAVMQSMAIVLKYISLLYRHFVVASPMRNHDVALKCVRLEERTECRVSTFRYGLLGHQGIAPEFPFPIRLPASGRGSAALN